MKTLNSQVYHKVIKKKFILQKIYGNTTIKYPIRLLHYFYKIYLERFKVVFND